jgi:hypothetical protein
MEYGMSYKDKTINTKAPHKEDETATLQDMLFNLRTSYSSEDNYSSGDEFWAGCEVVNETDMDTTDIDTNIDTTKETVPPVGTTFHPQDIVAALSKLQIGALFSLYKTQGKESANIIKAAILEELSHLTEETEEKDIHQTDIETIDIICMLFDFILKEPNLSVSLKALFTHLQIPFIKVAILDPRFFSKTDHPARQLLNELAHADCGLKDPDSEQNNTYRMVRYIVDRIVMEFDQDPAIFELLLQEFSQFMQREQDSNKLIEDRKQHAREIVAREIEQRFDNYRIPELVSTIILNPWKLVLQHLYLRDGEKSHSLETALKIMDGLVWSVQPKLIVKERQKLLKAIPRIINGLRDGMTLIQFDLATANKLLEDLKELHLACLRGSIPDELRKSPKQSTKQNISETPFIKTLSISEDDFGVDLSAFPESDVDEYSDHAESLEGSSPSQFAGIIRKMEMGTWIEFTNPDTGEQYRGKLSWKCKVTEEFTFVDHTYRVVADLGYQQLLQVFEKGHAKIVEDVPLFDLALNAVVVDIKAA